MRSEICAAMLIAALGSVGVVVSDVSSTCSNVSLSLAAALCRLVCVRHLA